MIKDHNAFKFICSCRTHVAMFTVNTSQDYKGGLEYDPVPYLNFGTDHLGHLFVMGKNLGSEDCVLVGQ